MGSKKVHSLKGRRGEVLRKRKMAFERFEARALLAADCFHNIEVPEDTDGSGEVSALDALAIINQLNGATNSSSALMTDVDADSETTPLDVLSVVNHLNRHGSGRATSSVATADRIARIERSISDGTLASAFTLDDAIDIIATLRSGMRPELGQRLSASHTNSTSFTERLTQRLTDAGVDSEIIETIVSEIDAAKEAGDPLTKSEVLARLTELGVDVDQVFPTREVHTPSTERFIEKLTTQLTAANVPEETIETITTEIQAAADAGTPLTHQQAKARLTELGVDVTAIFPIRSGGVEQLTAWLSSQLTAAGVDESIIATITQEIEVAFAAGEKWSLTQIEARLVEIGVDVSTIDLSPPHRGGRGGHRGRR